MAGLRKGGYALSLAPSTLFAVGNESIEDFMQQTDPALIVNRTPGAPESATISVAFMDRRGHLLYPEQDSKISLFASLMKADSNTVEPSKQGVAVGLKSHPFDFDAARKFKLNNVQHSTCIQAAKQALVGLGFEDDSVEDKLDPLCEISLQDTLGDAAEDFLDTGNGYIEVVRRGQDSDKITGLHHLPTNDVHIYIENAVYDRHFRVRSTGSNDPFIGGRIFARFGEKQALLARMKDLKADQVSEVIHFRQSTSMSRWYGYARWLAATASIELMQALHQFSFDFFINRGVPEFILFVKGAKVDKKDWDKIETAMKANIGLGNSHKSMAINLNEPDMEVQVEKLAMDGTGDSTMLRDMSETLALNIVSAHGVPPLLAGILIPGKLGATNELPNALQAFQALTIGPFQKTFNKTLAVSLGDSRFNGGLGLTKESFKLKKILDEIDLGTMDTVGRMRETVPEAKANGRDLSAGLKKSIEKFGAVNVVGMILGQALEQMEVAARSDGA